MWLTEWIFAGAASVILVTNIYMLLSFFFRGKKIYPAPPLEISVIIAAKNEEKNIQGLINSLLKLNYPEGKSEIIIVNDNSTDKTGQLLEELTFSHKNIKFFNLRKKKLAGKKGALDFGIGKAKFDNIAVTDADCRPEKEWLKMISDHLSAGFDLVFGAAPLLHTEGIAGRLALFDNLHTHALMFLFAYAGMPVSGTARSMAYRKTLLEKIGGYQKTAVTLSGDDDLVLKESVNKGFKPIYFIDNASFVWSEGKTTFGELFRQKQRHLSTSIHYSPLKMILLSLYHISNLLVIILPFIHLSVEWGIILLLKISTDLLINLLFRKKLDSKLQLHELLFYQYLWEFINPAWFISGNLKKTVWR